MICAGRIRRHYWAPWRRGGDLYESNSASARPIGWWQWRACKVCGKEQQRNVT